MACEIATALELPLDVFVVRRLSVPGHDDQTIGAVASGGIRVLHQPALQNLRDADQILVEATRREEAELARREQRYRAGRIPSSPCNRTVILVDDGLTTGATMQAAVKSLRLGGTERCIVAIPAAAPGFLETFEALTDDIICPNTPEVFHGEDQFYEDFADTTDEEVCNLLERAAQRRL